MPVGSVCRKSFLMKNQIFEPSPSYCDRWSQQGRSSPSIAIKILAEKSNVSMRATSVQNHPRKRNTGPKNGPT
jgi:hypothetical protein